MSQTQLTNISSDPTAKTPKEAAQFHPPPHSRLFLVSHNPHLTSQHTQRHPLLENLEMVYITFCDSPIAWENPLRLRALAAPPEAKSSGQPVSTKSSTAWQRPGCDLESPVYTITKHLLWRGDAGSSYPGWTQTHKDAKININTLEPFYRAPSYSSSHAAGGLSAQLHHLPDWRNPLSPPMPWTLFALSSGFTSHPPALLLFSHLFPSTLNFGPRNFLETFM